MVLTKPQIMTLFYLARLVSVICKQELQTFEISSKPSFNKTLLALWWFFRGEGSSYF